MMVTRPLAPLPLALVSDLVASYHRDRARWDAAPRAAEVRQRLERAERKLATAVDAWGDLLPADLELAGLDRDRACAHLAACRDQLALLRAGVQELDGLGAGVGGNRRLPGVLGEPPPRFVTLLRLRAALAVALGRPPTRRELADAAAELFTMAGDAEPERGLRDLVRQVPLTENRPEKLPVCPLHGKSTADTMAA